ncbi:hypothetical protein CBL_01423 [Carabus blaptoides fortunei]
MATGTQMLLERMSFILESMQPERVVPARPPMIYKHGRYWRIARAMVDQYRHETSCDVRQAGTPVNFDGQPEVRLDLRKMRKKEKHWQDDDDDNGGICLSTCRAREWLDGETRNATRRKADASRLAAVIRLDKCFYFRVHTETGHVTLRNYKPHSYSEQSRCSAE